MKLLKLFLREIKNGNCKLTNDYYELRFKNKMDILEFNKDNKYYLDLTIERYTTNTKIINRGWKCVPILRTLSYNTITKDITFFLYPETIEKHLSKYFKY